MLNTDRAIELLKQARELLKNDTVEYAVSKVDEIRAIIHYADWRYYVQDDPVLSDSEYDRLFALLKQVEKENPELLRADSPTQRIANGLSEGFATVAHLVPMLSLENSYNPDDVREWEKRCRNLVKGQTFMFTVEPKYDGAGISLIYENDILERGATRGDGIHGDDITVNIKQMRSVPLGVNLSAEGLETIELRGEVIIPKDKFQKYNEQRIQEGLSPLANPRNAASGTLRMLDPQEIAKRGLKAVLYHLSYHHNLPSKQDPDFLKSHYEILKWLHERGFATPYMDMKRSSDIEEIIQFCLDFEEKRDELPYEIDGMVVKIDQIDLQEKMGMTAHHPRWAMAYKFKARQATSQLLRVEFQVGRTGSITPVAKIEPVAIGGVMVSSISLFNEDVIKEKDIKIGDQVLVERAGDVIPYIVKSLADLRTGTETEILFPTHCPACEKHLVKPEGEAVWRCVNVNCPAQIVEHIIHFTSKDAMDIRNLGTANIRRFYELGLLKDIVDIYHLDFNAIRQLDKFGEKSIQNLQTAIEDAKHRSLYRLIFGLGIRYVGVTTAKVLAAAITHLKELVHWNKEQLCTLEGIGDKVASSIVQFFEISENIQLIDRLEAAGVRLSQDAKGSSHQEGSLSGSSFLFTGTLSHLKRSEAEELVEKQGGTILKSVSSKLNYLVVGEDAGSKLEKAKKLGTVKVITEAAFMEMIAGANGE